MEKKYQIMKNISHGLEKNFQEKIKYRLDNGMNYEIYRDFTKKNAKLFDENLEEISNQYVKLTKRTVVNFSMIKLM